MDEHRASHRSPSPLRAALLVAAFVGAAIVLGAFAQQIAQLSSPAERLRGELRQALIDPRPFRPRLSVAVPHGSCAPTIETVDATCGDAPAPRLRTDLLSAMVRARSDRPDPQLDRLRAVAAMVASPSPDAYERSVRRLEHALAVDPNDPEILNDLAVAYGLRASRGRDPRDLLRALVAAERATRRAPDAPEPAFNRALFLRWLGLLDSAERAWQLYLARFDEPGYRDEARDELERLRRDLAAGIAGVQPDRIFERLRNGSERAALELASADLQRAREVAVERLLAAWAAAVLSGDAQTAEPLLATARTLGHEIERRHGECTVSSMVERIDAADPIARERLAEAHVALARGSELFRSLRSEEALPLFATARRLTPDREPAHLWASMGGAGVDFYRHDHAAAAAGFRELLASVEGGCLHALAGRAAWGMGLTRLRQGRYTASLAHLRQAEDHFLSIDEAENLGAVRTILGENLALLGQREPAWEAWLHALQALERYRGSLRLHNLLWNVGRAAAEEVGPEAAVILQDEGVLNARRSGDAGLLAEALLWRGRFRAAAGDVAGALADLERADRFNRTRPAGPAPLQVAADLELARGIVLAQREEPTAIEHLSKALEHYRLEGLVLPQPEVLLARARVQRRLGEPRAALRDLEDSLALSREQRSAIADNHLRRSFTEWIQAAYEEAIDVSIQDLGAPPEETLLLADEARDVPFAWEGAPAATARDLDPLPVLHRRLAAEGDAAVLVFASTPSRLHRWLVHRGEVRSDSRPIERSLLERRVRRFVAAVERGGSLQALAAESSQLHRLLVPAAITELAPGTPLVVVPDRALAALPFDLLREPSTGRLLVEDRPVSLAPSLRFLASSLDPENRLEAPPIAATLIADPAFDPDVFPALPRLGRAQGEAARIAELYMDAELLSGPAATPEAVRAALDRNPVLHYAGHAVFNPVEPTLSYLPVAPGGMAGGESALFARDLARHPLRRLRLVVLSACSTLGPTDLRTAAISGIARPFLDAGATAVVGTLWPVEDTEAAELFPEFHRRFLASGDAVDALWQAKLAAVRENDPRHPRSARWAAFQIVGQAGFGMIN